MVLGEPRGEVSCGRDTWSTKVRTKATSKALAAIVLLLALSSTVGACGRGAGSGPIEISQARSPLKVTETDFFHYLRADATNSYTAIPIGLRLEGTEAIDLTSVRVMHRENLRVVSFGVLGPRAPSIAGNVYPGWPFQGWPVGGSDGFRLTDVKTVSPTRGLRLVTDQKLAWKRGSITVTPDGGRLRNDLPNETTPVFHVRAEDPSRSARGFGLEIEYTMGGKRFRLTLPAVEFGVCTPREFAKSTCERGGPEKGK